MLAAISRTGAARVGGDGYGWVEGGMCGEGGHAFRNLPPRKEGCRKPVLGVGGVGGGGRVGGGGHVFFLNLIGW